MLNWNLSKCLQTCSCTETTTFPWSLSIVTFSNLSKTQTWIKLTALLVSASVIGSTKQRAVCKISYCYSKFKCSRLVNPDGYMDSITSLLLMFLIHVIKINNLPQYGSIKLSLLNEILYWAIIFEYTISCTALCAVKKWNILHKPMDNKDKKDK